MGGGRAKNIFSLFPSPIPHHLTDGGRKVVTLTRPNKTPARKLRRQPRSSFAMVQSLNSPFFPPHIGARAEPGRAKEESRITTGHPSVM